MIIFQVLYPNFQGGDDVVGQYSERSLAEAKIERYCKHDQKLMRIEEYELDSD